MESMEAVRNLINWQVEVAKRKIELLKGFLRLVRNLEYNSMSEDDLKKFTAKAFCTAYHSHYDIHYDDIIYAPNCIYCPLQSCPNSEFAEFLMKLAPKRRQ